MVPAVADLLWRCFWVRLLVVSLNPSTGIDRQHESWEAQGLYPSVALQLGHALRF
jgi:hypothetical protein